MAQKAVLNGKYLMYKGKPLVREKNAICYGSMEDKYILFLIILTNKKKPVPIGAGYFFNGIFLATFCRQKSGAKTAR